MGLDGARSATRRWLECGTCATRVTRGTFDFQARDRFELCAGKVQGIFSRGALKVAFKAEVSPTRHTRRTRPTPQLNTSAELHHTPQLNTSAELHHTP